MSNLESFIQKKIIDYLKKEYGYKSVKLIKTNKNGITDLLILLGNGKHIWIEVKQETGKESPLQEFRRKEFTAIGDFCMVVYGFEDFKTKFNKYESL